MRSLAFVLVAAVALLCAVPGVAAETPDEPVQWLVEEPEALQTPADATPAPEALDFETVDACTFEACPRPNPCPSGCTCAIVCGALSCFCF